MNYPPVTRKHTEKIILHAIHASADSKTKEIIVRSADRLLMHFCCFCITLDLITQSLLFDTVTGNERRLVDIKAICAKKDKGFIKSLFGFHAYTVPLFVKESESL